jgi:hypothetical protein
MLAYIRKMSIVEWKLMGLFVVGMVVAFGFGYVGFRYDLVELCRVPMIIGEYGVDF